jgi:hypothetical protein
MQGCYTSEVFDTDLRRHKPCEESFDQIALIIKHEVTFPFDFAVLFWRGNDLDTPHFEALDTAVGVTSFVAKQCAGLNLGHQRLSLLDVVDLASGKP